MADALLSHRSQEACSAAVEAELALAVHMNDPAAERLALGALAVLLCSGAEAARDAVQLSGLDVAHFVGPLRVTLAAALLDATAACRETDEPLEAVLRALDAAGGLALVGHELDLPTSGDPVIHLIKAVETLDGLFARRWAIASAWCLARDAANLVADPLSTLEAHAGTCAEVAQRARERLRLRVLAI